MAAGEHDGNEPPESSPTGLRSTHVGWVTPPDPVTPEPPRRIAERYSVQAQVGVGGMGAVYVVLDHELDEVVALKMLRPELARRPGFVARFRQEVKLARRVTHPNVARTFDLGEDTAPDGSTRLFLTMEYVDGRPLSHLLADEGRLSPVRVEPLLRGICAGLGAAHEAGVVHRDLKPDNVLVATNGRVVLTDFGIARALRGSELTHTLPGIIGTPAYMAPEQARGGAIDHRADLYALGAILFECVTGSLAWSGDDPHEVAMARVFQPAPDPRAIRPELSEPIASVIRRCLALEPDDRFPSALAVVEAWAAAANGVTTAIRPPGGPPRVQLEVPHERARTLAVLPFRAGSPDDAEVARGFAEELVDAFSMTRGLRVRPLGSGRGPQEDPGELGRKLGVEIVVDGVVRRGGTGWRVSLRTISVADGYQLGAWRFESDDPLGIVDQAAATVGRALTVELGAPNRGEGRPVDARAMDLYLRGKSLLRSRWYHPPPEAAELLGEAHVLAPDDPDVLAAYSAALARNGLFARHQQEVVLGQARALAERAVTVGPDRAEGWFALAACRMYGNDPIGAATALRNALSRAPGHAQAQLMLGGLQLEAGVLPEAMIRLRAAASLDPELSHARFDLARGHALLGEWDRALPYLEGEFGAEAQFGRAMVWARLRMWNRALPPPPPLPPPLPDHPSRITHLVIEVIESVIATGELPEMPAELVIAEGVDAEVGRLWVTRKQYQIELLISAGRIERALEGLDAAADRGLFDILWFDRCPVLDPVRARPEFARIRAKVADLARAVAEAARP